jgi:hypothetical protein
MNAPYAITTVVVNENIKKVVEPKKRKYKFMSYFTCAAIAGKNYKLILGAFATLITMPMDNIKTKLQTQNANSICEKLDSLKDKLSVNEEKQQPKLSMNYSTSFRPDCQPDQGVKYKNILSTMKIIYNENGFFKGFFKGLTPRILSNSPSCAISWGTYEFIKHMLNMSLNKK